MEDKYIGRQTKDKCPLCKKLLFKNSAGSEWCSDVDCSYFIHEGKPVGMKLLGEMSAKYSITK